MKAHYAFLLAILALIFAAMLHFTPRSEESCLKMGGVVFAGCSKGNY